MPFLSKKSEEDPRLLSRIVLLLIAILAAYSALHAGGYEQTPKWVVSFVATFFFLLLLLNKERVFYLPKGPIVPIWSTFILWICFTSVFSMDSNSSIGAMLLVSALIFSAVIVFALANTRSEINRFIIVMLIGTATVTIFGWVVYLIGRFSVQGGHEMVRHFIGPFFWKNPMGGYLILMFPLALVAVIEYKGIWSWLAGTLAVLMLSGMLLTRSRGSWLALLIMFLVVFVPAMASHRIKKDKWLTLFAILICGVLIGVFFAPPSELEDRAKSIATVVSPEIEGQSTIERIAMLKAGLEIIKDYPILGVGADCWPLVRYHYLSGLKFVPTYPHNAYLRTAAELGIPGLIILLCALILSYFPIFIDSYRKKTTLLLPAVTTGVGASLLHMAVDFDSAFAGILLPLALMFGLAHRLRVRDEIGLPRLKYGRRVVMSVLVLFGVLLVSRGIALNMQRSGRELLQIFEDEDAEKAFKVAAFANPIAWDIRLDYARTLSQRGKLKSAIVQTEKALSLAPAIPEIHRSIAKFYSADGDTDRAISHYKISLALSPKLSSEIYFELARLLRASGNSDAAAKVLFTMSANLEPYTGKHYTSETVSFKYHLAEAWALLSELFLEMGDTTSSLIAIDKASTFAEIREKDYPLAMMGIDALSPERVVANFFEAINNGDSTALRGCVADQKSALPRVSEGITLDFERVIQVHEDPINGKAKVEFIMTRTDSSMTVSIPSALWLVLDKTGWKVTFGTD